MNNLKSVLDTFYKLQKKMNHLLEEKVVQPRLEIEKRNYYKKYKLDPVDFEVKEMKKNIVMGKALQVFSIIMIGLLLVVFS
ncbi:hypothetical protein KM915_20955 [Cytobacillus oceanisediminis]|uniref:hypothetical protein n=1 Tax=Cytobacillus oceanisediminis TaxID=665099 RepID=UPI001C214AA0|nr:hypothetical protein [Cytobacillus oceanisediminis]MBU8732521.1 hypothetical protein [Cytobacillus oceanisediminis]